VVTLAAVLGLTRYAEPQHHHATAPGGRPDAHRAEPAQLRPAGTAG
jgi:hypothetical protein